MYFDSRVDESDMDAIVEIAETDAFFAPWVDAIAVNWGEASLQRPSTALRHELTHRMVWRISGYEERPLRFNGLDKEPPRIVPTWLDEGLAMLEDPRTPGAAWMATLTHVSAAVAARRGRFRLRDLTDLEKWNARSGDDGAYEYYFATETVRLLESDIGRRGIVDILERIRKGANLSTAYRAVTGF